MVALVIVPNDLKPIAEAAVSSLAPSSSGDSFIVPLQPAGTTDANPTHWACLPIVSNEAMNQIQALVHSPPFSPRSILGISEPDEVDSEFAALLDTRALQRVEIPKP